MPRTTVTDDAAIVHVLVTDDTPQVDAALNNFLDNLWTPAFPSPDGLDLAAQTFDAAPTWNGEEGPRPRVVLSAGGFAVEAPDLARRDKRHERAEEGRRKAADMAASYLARGEDVPEADPSREITGWSRKSRANMVRAFCEINYLPMLSDAGRVPAMVTLTYSGDWLIVASNGKAAKRHLTLFRKRYAKAWGELKYDPEQGKEVWVPDTLYAIWKLEFQLRGAPHFHLLMVPPHGLSRIPGKRATASAWIGAGLPFAQWLSEIWADIVDHPDQEERERHRRAGTRVDYAKGLTVKDPKRVSVYFTKHGSFKAKEYQNCVPEEWQAPGQGPGRFWGYWNLERVTVAVELPPDKAAQAARLVRRWARAQGTTRQHSVPRYQGGRVLSEQALIEGLAGAQLAEQPERMRRRNVRRRVRRLASGKGFVSVNDGPQFAMAVARAISLDSDPRTEGQERAELAHKAVSRQQPIRLQPHGNQPALPGQEIVASPQGDRNVSPSRPPASTPTPSKASQCRCDLCGEPLGEYWQSFGRHSRCGVGLREQPQQQH